MQCNFLSSSLNQGTAINIIVPWPEAVNLQNEPGRPYPVLYLLHGVYGDASNWLRYTSIERYAQQYRLVVVMPSGANSFYQNISHGPKFNTYLSEELPALIGATLPVSNRREDTFIAGLSMGGYGACFLALQNPEKYSCAASLSGVVDINAFLDGAREGADIPDGILQQLNSIPRQQLDLFELARKQKNNGALLPKLFLSCGTEDFTYPYHCTAKEKFAQIIGELTCEEHSGAHDWAYWDAQIKHVLEWLPLEKI